MRQQQHYYDKQILELEKKLQQSRMLRVSFVVAVVLALYVPYEMKKISDTGVSVWALLHHWYLRKTDEKHIQKAKQVKEHFTI